MGGESFQQRVRGRVRAVVARAEKCAERAQMTQKVPLFAKVTQRFE